MFEQAIGPALTLGGDGGREMPDKELREAEKRFVSDVAFAKSVRAQFDYPEESIADLLAHDILVSASAANYLDLIYVRASSRAQAHRRRRARRA